MIEILSNKSLIALRKQQSDAFHKDKPLTRFNNVTAMINALDDDEPVLGLGIQNDGTLVFGPRGSALRELRDTEDAGSDGVVAIEGKPLKLLKQKYRGWAPVITNGLTPGCVPCVAEVDGVRYGAGLTIVAGRGDVGKTPFVHAYGSLLAGGNDYAVIRFGEPLSGYTTDFDSFVSDLAEAMITHSVIVIDSLKDVIASVGGNATTGGLSRGAFQLLSDLGSIAATRGCALVASINPTSNDDRIIELVNEAARSNATSLVVNKSDSVWDVVTRTGEGLLRVTHQLFSAYEDNVMTFNRGKVNPGQRTDIKAKQMVIKGDELESIVRRLTASN